MISDFIVIVGTVQAVLAVGYIVGRLHNEHRVKTWRAEAQRLANERAEMEQTLVDFAGGILTADEVLRNAKGTGA